MSDSREDLGYGQSADAMGSYSGGGRDPERAGEDPLLAAVMAAAKSVVPATLLSTSEFETKKSEVFKVFGATSKADKVAVEAALVVYFSVHGTSPNTAWSEYEHDIVALGKSVRPYVVVKIIGQSTIKKFMGRYSTYAIAAYKNSSVFQDAMVGRVTRAQLGRSEGYLAIDFVGKDGSLDAATEARRSLAKSYLVGGRNTQRAVDGKRTADEYVHAREVGGTGGSSADPFQ